MFDHLRVGTRDSLGVYRLAGRDTLRGYFFDCCCSLSSLGDSKDGCRLNYSLLGFISNFDFFETDDLEWFLPEIAPDNFDLISST